MHVVKKFIPWVYRKTLKCMQDKKYKSKNNFTYLLALFLSQSVKLPLFFSRFLLSSKTDPLSPYIFLFFILSKSKRLLLFLFFPKWFRAVNKPLTHSHLNFFKINIKMNLVSNEA